MVKTRTGMLLGIMLMVAILAALVFTGNPSPEALPVLSDSAIRRSFSIVVRGTGELEAVRSTVLTSQIRGDRGKIIFLVEEGSPIEEGAVLVRLDPTGFEEEVHRLDAKVREAEAVVSAYEQGFEWEKIQAEREIKSAEFDLRAAELELSRVENGDGPLELVRLEAEVQEAERTLGQLQGYFNDLVSLKDGGYVNEAEITRAEKRRAEAEKAFDLAGRKYESYGEYVLPSLLEKARAQVARAEMNREQTVKASSFKIGKALAALQKSREERQTSVSALQLARRELENTVIHAPIPGIVVLPEAFRDGQNRKPRVGDTVWQNQPLVYLPDISEMLVETEVREVDLHKIAVGKPARVRVEAYPDLQLTGQVRSIGVLARERTESETREQYFQVVISLRESDERLRPGMTARVEIDCARVESTLSIPVHAVFREEGSFFAYVSRGGRFERREVRLGPQNEDWVVIRHGLEEGQQVALSLPPLDLVAKSRRLPPAGE